MEIKSFNSTIKSSPVNINLKPVSFRGGGVNSPASVEDDKKIQLAMDALSALNAAGIDIVRIDKKANSLVSTIVAVSDNKDEEKEKSNYVMDYLPDSIHKKFGVDNSGRVCPNTLTDRINLKLRRNEELDADGLELSRAVDEAFEKLPPLKEDKMLYRAVSEFTTDKSVFDKKEGDIMIPDKGYMQAGEDEFYLRRKYLPASEEYKPSVFKIRCPKGSKVSFVPRKETGSGYEEYLFPKGAKFKVISKKVVDDPVMNSDGTKIADRKTTEFELEYI